MRVKFTKARKTNILSQSQELLNVEKHALPF